MFSFRSGSPRAVLLAAAAAVALAGGPGLAPRPALAGSTTTLGFADLAERLLPAVVNISSSQNVQARNGDSRGPEVPQFPPGSPFEQFFKDFMDRNKRG